MKTISDDVRCSKELGQQAKRRKPGETALHVHKMKSTRVINTQHRTKDAK